MMNDSELEQIVTDIAYRHGNNLFRDAAPASIKELRSIQLDALRHAREVVEKHHTILRDHCGDGYSVPNTALPDLDRLIRDLELR